MRDFKKLRVWTKGIEVAKKTYLLTSEFPSNERYGLISQMNRAAVSIPSNIAEGSGRRSEKEYRRFLEIALGSAFELETQLIISKEMEWSNKENIEKLLEQVTDAQRMITGFIKKLCT